MHVPDQTAADMKRDEALSKIRQITERVAEAAGLEVVDVELKGSGRHQMLRIVIDKPGGITHADCELITREAGDELDAVDPISGPYELEVSSPGVERPLKKWQDWERFVGQKVKVVLREPVGAGRELAAVGSETPEVRSGTPGVRTPGVRAQKTPSRNPAKSLELKTFDGAIAAAQNQTVTVTLSDGAEVTFPFELVSRANLKFEW